MFKYYSEINVHCTNYYSLHYSDFLNSVMTTNTNSFHFRNGLAYLCPRYLHNKEARSIPVFNRVPDFLSYIFSRVQAARGMIELTTGSKRIPLFHIDGKLNLADLLTKPHELSVEDLGIGSIWQHGASWMNHDSHSLPISQYQDLLISSTDKDNIMEECFIEPFRFDPNISGIHSIHVGQEFLKFRKPDGRSNFNLLVDPVSWGWLRSLRIMSFIVSFTQYVIHTTHSQSSHMSCKLCTSRGSLILEIFWIWLGMSFLELNLKW